MLKLNQKLKNFKIVARKIPTAREAVSEIVWGVLSSLFRSEVVDSFREHAFAEQEDRAMNEEKSQTSEETIIENIEDVTEYASKLEYGMTKKML